MINHLQGWIHRWRGWLRQVPNTEVAVSCTRCQQVGAETVKLKSFNLRRTKTSYVTLGSHVTITTYDIAYSSGVFLHLGKKSGLPACFCVHDRGRIPEHDRAIRETSCQQTELRCKCTHVSKPIIAFIDRPMLTE